MGHNLHLIIKMLKWTEKNERNEKFEEPQKVVGSAI